MLSFDMPQTLSVLKVANMILFLTPGNLIFEFCNASFANHDRWAQLKAATSDPALYANEPANLKPEMDTFFFRFKYILHRIARSLSKFLYYPMSGAQKQINFSNEFRQGCQVTHILGHRQNKDGSH